MVVQRDVGDRTVLPRISDGSALVLGPTAALVWAHLVCWRSRAELMAWLEHNYPDIAETDRDLALEAILSELLREDLVERPGP